MVGIPVAGILDTKGSGAIDDLGGEHAALSSRSGHGIPQSVPEESPGGQGRVDHEEVGEGKAPGELLAVEAAH